MPTQEKLSVRNHIVEIVQDFMEKAFEYGQKNPNSSFTDFETSGALKDLEEELGFVYAYKN